MNTVEKRELGKLICRRYARLSEAYNKRRIELRAEAMELATDASTETRIRWQSELFQLIEQAAADGFSYRVVGYILATETQANDARPTVPTVVDNTIAEYVSTAVDNRVPPRDWAQERDALLEDLYVSDISVAAKLILDRIPTLADLGLDDG
jgi:hypothetical protein